MAKRKQRDSNPQLRKRAAEIKLEDTSIPEPAMDDPSPLSDFLGDPVEAAQARTLWPHRYEKEKAVQTKDVKMRKSKNQINDSDNEDLIEVRCHYRQALVNDKVYSLNDDAHVQAGEGIEHHICRIIEIFETVNGDKYFTAQWYYRDRDTVMGAQPDFIDQKCIFFSDVKDDNPLELLTSKLHILRLFPKVDFDVTDQSVVDCDFYCSMKYELPYTTFISLADEENGASSSSTASRELTDDALRGDCKIDEIRTEPKSQVSELSVLDVFSGCGGMSSGLCMGANLARLDLVTRWAVDLNSHACESLKNNDDKITVRNEAAEDFLSLLHEYEELCFTFGIKTSVKISKYDWLNREVVATEDESDDKSDTIESNDKSNSEVYEVERLVDILFGIPPKSEVRGLYFKVRWKGFDSNYDLWTPVEKLENCRECVKEFVREIHQMKKLPHPGDVDVICGGPPCQGISGFNRFRNRKNPLADEKNKQLIVFMDIVTYLKPRYILMENVVDLLKFADGYLGRYAIARLVGMSYQARLGIMAAGSYGVPQFRFRVFLWGCLPSEQLPPYPLPTYNVVVRGLLPKAFERNLVAHDEGQSIKLNDALVLKDALYDLPAVKNDEMRDAMPYTRPPQTKFQQWIRSTNGGGQVYDHLPLMLNKDDYERVQRIPKKKGANYRDLPGVLVDENNKAYRDPNVKELLSSGSLLVPNYAISFMKGRSLKPFGRLWWDETVSTVVTRAQPHNQIILHPEQDRVLTVRENARLQGFPDNFKFYGPVSERYVQIGNAVAVNVSTVLGFSLAKTVLGHVNSKEPLLLLPPRFPDLSGE